MKKIVCFFIILLSSKIFAFENYSDFPDYCQPTSFSYVHSKLPVYTAAFKLEFKFIISCDNGYKANYSFSKEYKSSVNVYKLTDYDQHKPKFNYETNEVEYAYYQNLYHFDRYDEYVQTKVPIPFPSGFWDEIFEIKPEPDLIDLWTNKNSGDWWYDQYDSYVYEDEKFSMSYFFQEPVSAYPFDKISGDDISLKTPRPAMSVTYVNDPDYYANVYIFPGFGDDDLVNNSIIVADAFDPSSSRDAFDIYTNPKYKNLLSTNLSPRSSQSGAYDIIFIDFSQGGGNLLINSEIQLAVVNWLEQRTTSKYVLGGPSMSGVIARLTLLLGQEANLISKCKGYISIDSPQQGASIAQSLQKAMSDLSDDLDVNLMALVGDIVIGAENSSIDAWQQLNVPGAHQMLYSHYYRNDGFQTTAYENFYKFLEDLGGYAKAIPKVAIAYSNFHKPHGSSIDISLNQKVGEVDGVTSIRSFRAGGDGSPEMHELVPGSVGNWYYELYNKRAPKNRVNSNIYGGEHYKGTFVPIYSALDLSPQFDIFSNPSISEIELAKYSKFDAVFFMKDAYNGYPKSLNEVDDKRYEHIIFDEQCMSSINSALLYIENFAPTAIITSAIITPLLLN